MNKIFKIVFIAILFTAPVFAGSGNLTRFIPSFPLSDENVSDNITIDLATTASSLAANGTNCSAGSFPLGVDAAGNVESCTVAATGDITAVMAGTGLIGGGSSGDVTLNVDVGTSSSQIVQLNGSAQLPSIDGSLLTNITPADNTVTASKIVDGSITTSDISNSAGITDTQVSDTLTSSIFVGSGSTTNAIDLATAEAAGTLPLNKGGTNSDLSATGGANQFVKQTSVGGALSVGTIADADVPDALTISGGTINNSIIGGSTPAAGTFTSLNLGDDSAFNFGAGQCLWETADADANALLCALPEGDATDVPGLIIADASSTNVDLGMFNGITDPFLAIVSDDQTKNFRIQHNGTNAVMTVSSGDILMSIQGANLRPATNDSAALGSSSTMWSDLFLASGGVLDFNAGDVTVTHSSNALSIDGASTITVNAKITQSGLTEFSSGTAMTASSYQCGRDNDATNQYHCNVPIGAGYELSINDFARLNLTNDVLSLNVGHTEKFTSTSASTYAVNTSDYIIHSTRSSTGTQTIDLPGVASNSGRTLIIKDAAGNAAANNITLDGVSSETIDGATTFVMNTNYQSVRLYCNGTAWFTI